jgi:chromosome segregation protein
VIKCLRQRGIELYLKRLEIVGFKSFADKIQLEFQPGVTAVVGPNGSGKSNISDALRWVLGEQSIRNLRGTKMDDVIFAGSELRKPLGLAEVTILLDNADHAIPIDFNEVAVTRRFFRSGESEYLINKSPVRLKDIHELFYDTGIGKEAYSVIGQGKIDAILSAKAEERRTVFEEAAGIIKYKTRKQVAERKLEDTDRNLLRAQDILRELEGQLGPLKEQAALAGTYLGIKERLTLLEVNHFGGMVQQLEDRITELHTGKNALEERFRDFEGEESVMEAANEEIRLELTKRDETINQLNQDYIRIQGQIEKFQEQIQFHGEKIADLRTQQEEAARNAAAALKRQETLLIETDAMKSTLSELTGRATTFQTDLERIQAVLRARNAELAEKELEEQTLKDEVIEALKTIAALKNKVSTASLQKDFITKQMADCERKAAQLAQQLAVEETEFTAKQADFTTVAAAIEQGRQSETELAARMVGFEDELRAVEAKNREWREKIRGLESKIGLLEEMERSYQGYFQGVKAILQDAADAPFHKAVHGIVVDLIKTKPGMELAIETALGSALQHIVISDDQQAQEAVAYLKKTGKGRATFLPLNRIETPDLSLGPVQVLLKQHSCQTAISLLEFAPEYRSILNYLLGQVLVAPDLKTAVRFSASLEKSFRIVTPEGDLVHPGGAITGGSIDKRRLGLLTRRREIEEIQAERAESVAFLEKGQHSVAILVEQLKEIAAELELTKRKTHEEQLRRVTLEREVHTLEQQRTRIAADHTLYDSQLEELRTELTRFDADKDGLNDQICAQEVEFETLQVKLTGLSETIKTAKQAKEAVQVELTSLTAQLSGIGQEQAGKEELQRRLSLQSQELESAHQDSLAKQEQLKAEAEKTLAAIGTFETRIIEERGRLTAQEGLIGNARQEKEAILVKLKEVDTKQRSYRRKNNDYQNQLHKIELALSQTELQILNIQENLSEDYGPEWMIGMDPRWEEPVDAEGQLETVKQELRELGSVNLAAIDDFCQVEERYDFLTSQADDLIKARESLLKVIYEIERTIIKRFVETMENVEFYFKQIFADLFEGGHAGLFLLDPEKPLDSGIEIVAQPPGKKLQSLSLLSGGERAMTAIALLFAVLSVKPSPFCVLDEIDATLDDVNVHRFSMLLELFSQKLQFVVVTHRRGTMEVANALYGVTMEELGVSKLISLDLGRKAG